MAREKQIAVASRTNPNDIIAGKNGITNGKRAELDAKLNQTNQARIDAAREKGRAEVNNLTKDIGGLFYETGRKVVDGAINIVQDSINSVLFPPIGKRTGDEPNFGRAKVGEMYDELASHIDPNYKGNPLPRIDTSPLKYNFRSEMMRRDINGKLDGDGIKAGDTITTTASILAPMVVGKVLIPAESPQSLKTIGGLPEVEAVNSVSNTGKAIADVRKFSEYIFTDKSKGKDVVFRNLGYSEKNSIELTEIWQNQASQKYAKGEFTLGKNDKWGQRIDIEIKLEGVGQAKGKYSYLKSGWMLNSDGSISLNTPFSGFTRGK